MESYEGSFPQIPHTYSSSHTYKSPCSAGSFKVPQGEFSWSLQLETWINMPLKHLWGKDILLEGLKGLRIQIYTHEFTMSIKRMQMLAHSQVDNVLKDAQFSLAKMDAGNVWRTTVMHVRVDDSCWPQMFRFTNTLSKSRDLDFPTSFMSCLFHGENQP